MFWHAAAFIKPGGRMGIVTSNAWLDVGTVMPYRAFFWAFARLSPYLKAAVSRGRAGGCEHSGDNSRALQFTKRARDKPAHFVKIKRPLAELMPWDIHLDGLRRWVEIDKLIQRISATAKASDDPIAPHTVEDDDFRIRTVTQNALTTEVSKSDKR